MRKISILIGISMITSCYAWQIINMNQYIHEMQSQLTEESLKLEEKTDARLPVSSNASVGKVEQRKVSLVNFSSPVFIIGGDVTSRQWLQKNATQLEAIHALGFITNIESSEQLHALQQLTKAPLLPTNVDDLMDLFQESHYPLVLHKDKLWQ